MSSQVDRLQALLSRVQQNRAKPRSDGGAASREHRMASARPVAPSAANAPSTATAPLAAQREPMRPESRPAPRPEPRAAARVEPRDLREIPTGSAPRPALDAPPPALTMSAGLHGDPVIIDPPVPQPSKPVVQVVSKHPPSVALTFGELLRRSLSLRPR